jgi:pimeloyl-ACP methyl ester carboxylesterase
MARIRIGLGVVPLGIAFVGIGAVMARYLREIRAARERLDNLGSQVLETDCGPIEYARIGQGPPVLVVHGDMGGFDQGLLLAKPIFDSGFQLISISRFGYLRSPLPEDANINLQADACARLLDALGIQQTAVFAFSAGATSAIRFAARHPRRVSALILLAPAAPGKVQVASPPRAVFDTLLRGDFIYWAMITYLRPRMQSLIGVPRGFDLTSEMEAEVKDALASSLPLSERISGAMFDTYDPGLQRDFRESISETSPYPLGEIKTPVLVINAADDPYAVLENVCGLAGHFPNARLFVVPDGGHPLLGHTREVREEITQFLNGIVAVPNGSR